LLQRARPLRPALRRGARVRDVRRARGDDAPVRAAPASLREVDAMRRKWIAPSAVVWLIVAFAFFLLPLLATLLFSLKSIQTGKCCTNAAYSLIIHDHQFWHTIRLSFVLALETIAISLVLFVPTLYWVHLKLPRLRPVLGFMALVPF